MAKKANGKARKKTSGKAKKVRKESTYDVGLVPFDGKLTPARAKRWLEKEHAAFHWLATCGLGYAKDEWDREAFIAFTSGVKDMADACADAMSGGSVVVISDVGGVPGRDGTYCFGRMQHALRVLCLPSLTRDSINQVGWSDAEFDAFNALVRFVERYVSAASEPESKASREAMRRRFAENEASRPNARLDVLHERREALKAERDAALRGVTVAVDAFLCEVAEPWNRRLDHLKYEEDLIWHEFDNSDVKHPGKPPDGYEPVTGPAAAS